MSEHISKRGQMIKRILKLSRASGKDEDRFWEDLCNWIEKWQVIPIISGSLFYDLIFKNRSCENAGVDCPESEPIMKPTVVNWLSENWACQLQYLLPDRHELPRVAQYMLSKDSAPVSAKNEYLMFLKEFLLDYALQCDSPRPQGRVELLYHERNAYSFSDLAVRELGFLEFGPGRNDPLSVLAGLQLPIYITTSYHDILELALKAMGKEPITQVCFWSGEVTPLPEHEPLKKLDPSPQRPLVYHLFGLEHYPLSLVLTEDDYLDFLVEITLRRKGPHPVIPAYLRAPLSTSSLMLLGYRLQDWDFRTLFRGVIGIHEKQHPVSRNTIFQLSLDNQYDHNESDTELHEFFDNVQEYIQNYFKTKSFEIYWSDPINFLKDLHDHMEKG